MANKPVSKVTKGEQAIQNAPLQVIYVDKILGGGFGPAVSRLTLGMEVRSNTFAPFATLVVPTQSLIEALESLNSTFYGDAAVKNALCQGLENLKMQLDRPK